MADWWSALTPTKPGVKIEGLDEVIRAIDTPEMKKIAKKCIKDTMRGAREAGIKRLQDTYTVKTTPMRKAITERLDLGEWGRAVVIIKGGPMSIKSFDSKLQKKSVQVHLRWNRPMKVVPHAFTATATNPNPSTATVSTYRSGWRRAYRVRKPPPPLRPLRGKRGYYTFLPKEYRLPILEVVGLKAPEMFDSPEVFETLQEWVSANVDRLWQQAAEYYST